jgi:hypothetical protein
MSMGNNDEFRSPIAAVPSYGEEHGLTVFCDDGAVFTESYPSHGVVEWKELQPIPGSRRERVRAREEFEASNGVTRDPDGYGKLEDIVSSIRIQAERLCEADNADDAHDAKLELEAATKKFDKWVTEYAAA